MYSPKIDEQLIPRLYRVAQARRMPLTKLVDGILSEALDRLEKGGEQDDREGSEGQEGTGSGAQSDQTGG